ncbi:MAG TPA: NAD(P)-binding domain-containing protein [Actinomycetota bacterium]|nr:NAD(P)-binding domain-containing protein [Actinomycetota bacterium]
MVVDCVVVGAGPAGLAASAALSARGIGHVVLERGRVGQSWRAQRWDSFRLNTAGWMNQLLGEQAHDAYAGRHEVVRRLEQLAAVCPVREGVDVARVAPAGGGFTLRTDGGDVRTRAVVVATGDQNLPRVPAVAGRLPGRVAQYHAANYRGPGLLPAGAVLVVGSAQSGCQIAEDLLAGGRRVILATSPVGRVPFRHRGRQTVEWLVEAGFMDQRPGDLPDPSAMRAAMPIIAPGRGLSLPALARAGPTWSGGRSRWTATGSPSTTASPPTWPPGTRSPPGPGRWSTSSSAAAAWTRRPRSPTSTTSPSAWIRRRRSTCGPRRSAAWCGARASAATSPSWTRRWSGPTRSPGARAPPPPSPASGTWGCAG